MSRQIDSKGSLIQRRVKRGLEKIKDKIEEQDKRFDHAYNLLDEIMFSLGMPGSLSAQTESRMVGIDHIQYPRLTIKEISDEDDHQSM